NAGRIVLLTPLGATEGTIQDIHLTPNPRQAVFFENEYWIADTIAGLSKYSGASFTRLLPNAPASVINGGMQVLNNTLWASAGAVNPNWEALNNKNGLFTFKNNEWTNYNSTNIPALDTLPDCITVATDPVNASLWAGSFGGGLLNLKADNTVTVYKQNSPIDPAYFNTTSYRVSGLAFDADNN